MPLLTDNRTVPLASLELYAKGQGDPVVRDRGLVWVDLLQESWKAGTISEDGDHVPLLEVLEGIGLVCRPFLRLQDTRLTDWAEGDGTWQERRPSTGSPRRYRVVQTDTTAALEWDLTKNTAFPEDGHFAFSLLLPDTPADWDPNTPPYVQLEFGGGAWAIRLDKTNGCQLLRRNGDGDLVPVLDLPEPAAPGYGDIDEKLIGVRLLRGKLGVSTDFGKTYTWWTEPDGSAATIPAGTMTLRGRGGQCVFGLHQLKYFAGQYTSYRHNVLATRTIAASLSFAESRYAEPGASSVAFSDQSSPTAGWARYRLTLTPEEVEATPWEVYRTPEVYSVVAQYPVVTSTPSYRRSRPFDDAIQRAMISKPFDLDGGNATVTIRKDAATQLVWNSGRYPKVRLWLGHVTTGGATRLINAFTGYIEVIAVKTDRHGESVIELSLVNVSQRFRRTKWTKYDRLPLGGRTLNAALDRVLYSEGIPLNNSWRIWHPAGDVIPLPAGLPEDPFEWPPVDEPKWDTLQRIAGYGGLEIVPTDAGILRSLPRDYVSPRIDHVLALNPASDLTTFVQSVDFRLDSSESATAVLIEGKDEAGRSVLGYGLDGQAERNPNSPRFCPWREVIQEQLPGTCDVRTAILRARQLGIEHFALKFDATVTLPANLLVGRRQRVRVTGSKVGIADWDQFAVLSIQHEYVNDPSMQGCTTTLGLRRLN